MDDRPKKHFRPVLYLASGVCLIVLMLYMGGVFRTGKIGPGVEKGLRPEGQNRPADRTFAERKKVVEYYEAVGTVRPKMETRIEAQITGRILEIPVRPGDRTNKGDLLVVLDNRESRSRLDQAGQGLASAKARREKAKEALSAARAVLNQAESAYNRVKTYFESEAATKQQLEIAESSFLQAKAGMKQAEDGLREAGSEVKRAEKVIEQGRISLEYNKIKAPESGEVVKRLAEPGDLAWPGKPLLILQTRSSLRLEAQVREGLIHHVTPGTELDSIITALGKRLKGVVEEVVPSANPMTRTFLVKVGLPDQKGLFPGMFGRLLIPVEETEVIVVPQKAIRRIGQLEVVSILDEDRPEQVYIKTGRVIDGDWIEVLSGLEGGENLALRGENDG